MLETPARTPVVYVVDDEPSVRDALRLLFQSVGMKVVAFENAHAALSGCLLYTSRCV